MKRKLTFLMALVMLLSLMSTSAQAIKLSELSPEVQAEVKAMMEDSAKRYEEMKAQAENPVETAKPVNDTKDVSPWAPERGMIAVRRKFDGTPISQSASHFFDYTGLGIYPDVPETAWYAQAVNAMSKGGLLQGKPDGLFHPDDVVTQAEFAIILCRVYGYDYTKQFSENSRVNNCDIHYGYEDDISIKRHWALPAIWTASLVMEAYKLNLAGYTADDPVWRGDAINQLVWAVGNIPSWTNSGNGQDLKQFTEKVWTEADIPDWDDASFDERAWLQAGYVGREYAEYSGHDWSAHDILEAYNAGLTQGVDAEGTCNAHGELTRAELCQMLYNAGLTDWGDVPRRGITTKEWIKWRDANNPYK